MSFVCCSRVFVFLMNLLMLLVALASIALLLWIRLDNGFESQLRQNIKVETDPEPLSGTKYDIRVGITVAFWVLIGFSAALAIIGFAGLLGAAVRSKALLVIYFVCMLIVILLEIAIGIYVLVDRKKVRNTVKNYVSQSYQLNAPDVSAFQYRYNCCGVENFSNTQCMQGMPTCSSAVWDRLDFTMMVFGLSMIGVVVLQIVTSFFTIAIVGQRKHEESL